MTNYLTIFDALIGMTMVSSSCEPMSIMEGEEMTDEQKELVDFIAEKTETLVLVEASINQARAKLQKSLEFDDKKFSNTRKVIRYMKYRKIK